MNGTVIVTVGAVRQHEVGPRAEALDDREDVVPAAGVQARAQWSRSSYRIASISKAAGTVSIRTVALIVPRSRPSASSAIRKASRQSAASRGRLELRDVEVGAGAALEQHLGVAVHVQPEVHERAGHLVAVDLQVALGQVQPARAHQQHGVLLLEAVLLALLLVLHRAADGVGEVDLAVDHVGPGGRVRVLEVRHEPARARVERVDDHLARGRPGDLDAPVLQRRRAPARP